MTQAISETDRRRKVQAAYNAAHGITPTTIQKVIQEAMSGPVAADYFEVPLAAEGGGVYHGQELVEVIEGLRKKMMAAAEQLDFEEAATLRDQIRFLKDRDLGLNPMLPALAEPGRPAPRKRSGGRRR
jgi:excinuclease ABC subunit B